MAPPVLNNLQVASAAWRDEHTGLLLLVQPGHTLVDQASVRAGGLVDAGRAQRLARALATGRVRFEPQAVDGLGDRQLLGRILATVARAFSRRVTSVLPDETRGELVLPSERLVGCVSEELIDRLLGRPAAVGALLRSGTATADELRALTWIGVVRLHRRRARAELGARIAPYLPAPEMVAPGSAPRPVLAPLDVCGDETPQIDEVPIPMPEEEGAELGGAPVVLLGLRAPASFSSGPRLLEGVAFGEEQSLEAARVATGPQRADKIEENLESLKDIQTNLAEYGVNIEQIPLFIQKSRGPPWFGICGRYIQGVKMASRVDYPEGVGHGHPGVGRD